MNPNRLDKVKKKKLYGSKLTKTEDKDLKTASTNP